MRLGQSNRRWLSRRADIALPLLVVVASAVAIEAPWWHSGFLLSYDMVFVSHQPVTADVLGAGSQTPRAVPSDLVVAVLGQLLPAQLVQRLVLVGIVIAAGAGAALLSRGSSAARAAAALGYLWTPYLAEHLQLGQWAVLLGYAGLPWILLAAGRVREERPRSWPPLLLALGWCAVGGVSSWLLAAIAVLPALAFPAAGRSAGERGRAVGFGLLAQCGYALPWLVPTLLRPVGIEPDRGAAAVFAARADSVLGALGSVLTGGGGWNAQVDPPGRATLVAGVGAAVVLVLGLIGLTALLTERSSIPLLISGVVGLVITLASLSPVTRGWLAGLPGGGLLRDGQRYLAPWVLLIALGFGATVDLVRSRLADTGSAAAVWLVVLLPVAVLPGLGWGVSGRLQPIHYPADFAVARQLVQSDPRAGAVLVLPFSTYRAFDWNGGRTSLDPLPRMLDRTVISASTLPVMVSGRLVTVAGDDPLAARVGADLRDSGGDTTMADRLGRRGIRWVIVDATSSVPSGLNARYRGPDVQVYEVPKVNEAAAEAPAKGYAAPRTPVLAGLVIAGLLVLGNICVLIYWWVAKLLVSSPDPNAAMED